MATAIEYGLISALVGVSVILAVTAVGKRDAVQAETEEPPGLQLIGGSSDASGTNALRFSGCSGGYELEELGDGTAELRCRDPIRAAPLP